MSKYIIEIGQCEDWYVMGESFNTYREALDKKNEIEAKHPEYKEYNTELRITAI